MTRTSPIGPLLKNVRSAPRLAEAFRKLWMRIREPANKADTQARLARYASMASSFDAWARGINPDIHTEIAAFWTEQESRVAKALSTIDLDLGGGGHGKLLYFVTRALQPQTVVETGVAAGHSSRSILAALKKNGSGTLYSSDLPYMLVDNADAYIGVVVEEELRGPWKLFTEGDRANLRQIAAQVQSVDLLHYDSDKTVAGRDFALESLADKLTPSAVIIFDDIQDNDHFDVLSKRRQPDMQTVIFQFGSKSVGVLIPRTLQWDQATN
jgi:predicted O-methyltransferase YrrM